MKLLVSLCVGLPGLEPGKAGPESAVLPLHHSPELKFAERCVSFAGAKVGSFRETGKLFPKKM